LLTAHLFAAWRKNSRRPSGVRTCSGSSSPRASPNASSSASSIARTSARISRAIRSNPWLTSGLALPAILVPSIDTTPGPTSPARSHSLSTSANSAPSARSWRQINRAIVA
jgi:hypothetical protein